MHTQEIRLPNGVAIALTNGTSAAVKDDYVNETLKLYECFLREVDTAVMTPEAVVLRVDSLRQDMTRLVLRTGMIERIY